MLGAVATSRRAQYEAQLGLDLGDDQAPRQPEQFTSSARNRNWRRCLAHCGYGCSEPSKHRPPSSSEWPRRDQTQPQRWVLTGRRMKTTEAISAMGIRVRLIRYVTRSSCSATNPRLRLRHVNGLTAAGAAIPDGAEQRVGGSRASSGKQTSPASSDHKVARCRTGGRSIDRRSVLARATAAHTPARSSSTATRTSLVGVVPHPGPRISVPASRQQSIPRRPAAIGRHASRPAAPPADRRVCARMDQLSSRRGGHRDASQAERLALRVDVERRPSISFRVVDLQVRRRPQDTGVGDPIRSTSSR